MSSVKQLSTCYAGAAINTQTKNTWPYQLALVTGASSGLGQALAYALAQKGIPLLLTGRDFKKLEEFASQLRVPSIVLAADLTIPTERQKLIRLIQFHTPDLIINNAGCGLYGDALSLPTLEQLQLIELNTKALVEISLEGAQNLIKKGRTGTILNVSSASAFFPYPSFSLYAASKAFVNHFSEAFDSEVSPHGIRVLTTCPGQIDTDFRNRASHGFPKKQGLWIMSAPKAAQLILKQIERKAPRVQVIDWRYRLVVCLCRLLPKSLVMALSRKIIQSRCR